MSKKVTFEADGISVDAILGSTRNPNRVQVNFRNPADPSHATGYAFSSATLSSESDASIVSTIQGSAEFAKGLVNAKNLFLAPQDAGEE